MSKDTHDLRFLNETTLLNVHNGGRLVLHQTRYKESKVKTFVTGHYGVNIFYSLQKQRIRILFGDCKLHVIKQMENGEKFEALVEDSSGEFTSEANSTLRFKVTKEPCILVCTPEHEPNQPGGKDDLPVVR